MNNTTRFIIIALVVAAAAGAFYLREDRSDANIDAVSIDSLGNGDNAARSAAADRDSDGPGEGIPRLICFGAERCVPCRMMVPVRKALTEEYPDTLSIQFVDVWQDRTAGQRHNIRMIPTTVFVDADGKEQYRQEGFLDKETIVAKFKELDIDIEGDSDETST